MNIPRGYNWSPQESAAINEFLNTPLGKRWLDLLYFQRPRTVIDKGTEAAALSGAFAAGYESVFAQVALSRVAVQEEEPMTKTIDLVKD
jgi:hypothetical protein